MASCAFLVSTWTEEQTWWVKTYKPWIFILNDIILNDIIYIPEYTLLYYIKIVWDYKINVIKQNMILVGV